MENNLIITAARLRAQGPLRRSRRKGNEFFEVIFVTVSWLLVAEPPMQFEKIIKLFRTAITGPLIHFLFPSAAQQMNTLIELR